MQVSLREILIEEFLEPKNLPISKFLFENNLTDKDLENINQSTAKVLSRQTGLSVSFWLKISSNKESLLKTENDAIKFWNDLITPTPINKALIKAKETNKN